MTECPQRYDDPWREDEEEARDREERARRVTAVLAELGYPVGRQGPISREIVAVTLRLWREDELRCIPHLREFEGYADDDGFADLTYYILTRQASEAGVVFDLDAKGVLRIADVADDEAVCEDFERTIPVSPPENDLAELGNWAAYRASRGETSLALQAFARIQESDDPRADQAWVHEGRAGIYRDRGNLGRAIGEMELAVRAKQRAGQPVSPGLLVTLAEMEHERGGPAIARLQEAVEMISDWLGESYERDGGLFVIEASNVQIGVPRKWLVHCLKRCIALVHVLESDPARQQDLHPIKAAILATRRAMVARTGFG
jgi:hypothetical protein